MRVVLTYRDYAALPTLVVETLSRSTTHIDRGAKLQLYARHAVPYYWIVDPERRVVEVYRFAAGGYDVPERFGGNELTDLPPFEGWRLDPTSLWVA